MYVLDMCGYKKWVLQPQFTYRQPPQAHSAHSNMGGSEALTIKRGLSSVVEQLGIRNWAAVFIKGGSIAQW